MADCQGACALPSVDEVRPDRFRVRAPWLAGVLAALAGMALAGCMGGGDPPGEGPEAQSSAAIADFTDAWAAGDPVAMGAATDSPSAARKVSAAALDELRSQDTAIAPVGGTTCAGSTCTQKVTVRQMIEGVGTWTYQTTISASATADGGWTVDWSPQTLHPDLTARTAFDRVRILPPRAPILDRHGVALTRMRPIVDIGVVAGKVEPTTYPMLAHILHIDPGALRREVAAAQPDWFVEIYPLRLRDYEPIRDELLQVPGFQYNLGTMSLGPSAAWARPVLGRMGDATKETMREAGPLAESSDQLGESGLQLAYERQLAGTPGGRVDLVKAHSGEQVKTLWSVKPVPGKPLATTLDETIQSAAEDAVSGQVKTTALVAVQANTGRILAAANGPEISAENLAFVGQFPPGSTFKVISVSALLDAGVLTATDRVECPDTTVVGGKTFKNYDGGILPAGGTLTDAFAQSCNTTMVNLADRLDDAAIPDAAARFGIGADWDIGLGAYSGQVPEPVDLVERAASMIGQGRVLLSPLGMAMVAAAVDSGQPMNPELLPEVKPGGAAGDPLPSGLVSDLRTMMRAVVTEGTGSSVDLAGLPVSAKTGTAEYGPSGATRTHAWMIGFRGDLAFAVFVENGESGSHDAAPVVARFLNGLPASAYH
jgi:cell division protein FtsI/penicillin-binding protein 2